MLWLGAAALLVCAAAGAYYVSLSRRRTADASPPPRKRRQRGRRKAARPPPRSGGERPPATASAVRRLLEDRWEIVAATRGGGERVRFCGFNVLADQFSYGQRGHCSRRALAWARRFDAALGVLERSGADVICLQECDHGREWAERLGALGYAVARAERPSTEDAVAIAWRRGAFSRVVEEKIDFDDLVPVGSDALAARFRRGNVGLLVRLRAGSGAHFVVGSAHLHWDPDREDVKLAQMSRFLAAAEAFAAGAPVVLAGDFNSTPDGAATRLALDGFCALADEGPEDAASKKSPGSGAARATASASRARGRRGRRGSRTTSRASTASSTISSTRDAAGASSAGAASRRPASAASLFTATSRGATGPRTTSPSSPISSSGRAPPAGANAPTTTTPVGLSGD